jgi:hypothetical protein
MSERQDRLRNTVEEQAVQITKTGDDTPELALQLLVLEVLLDIRDSLYRTEKNRAAKWGSKL